MHEQVYAPSFPKTRNPNTTVLATLGAEAFNPALQNDAAIVPAAAIGALILL